MLYYCLPRFLRLVHKYSFPSQSQMHKHNLLLPWNEDGFKHDWATLFETQGKTLRIPKLPFSSRNLKLVIDSSLFFHVKLKKNLQILYKYLEYLFFSLTKVRIIKIIKCESCFINGPQFHFLEPCTL